MKTLLFTLFLFVSQFAVAHEQIDQILSVYPDAQKFIVADKEFGKIYVVDPVSKHIDEAPALYGKMPVDKVRLGYYDRKDAAPPYITPSGLYTVKKMYSDSLKKNLLVFWEGDYIVMAIHAVWTGNPVQKRPQRLMSDNPNDHKITNGCINVPADYFTDSMFILPENTRLFILPETVEGKNEWNKLDLSTLFPK